MLKNLLSLLHKRLFKNEKPELYYVRDMEQDYYDSIYIDIFVLMKFK